LWGFLGVPEFPELGGPEFTEPTQLNARPCLGNLAFSRRPDCRQSLIFSFRDGIVSLYGERDLHEHSSDNSGSPYKNERFSRDGVSLDCHTGGDNIKNHFSGQPRTT
jgi:hypothetical protein